MSQAFRNLALHPDCIAPLRKEIEEATRYGGWIKASIDKMHKLDSFLKETMRLSAGGLSPDFPTCMLYFGSHFHSEMGLHSFESI